MCKQDAKPTLHADTMLCLACRYPLGNLPYGPCPECGKYNEIAEVDIWQLRAEFVCQEYKALAIRVLVWSGIIILYATGAGICSSSASHNGVSNMFWYGVESTVIAGLILGAAFGLTALAGVLGSFLHHPSDHELARLIWMKHLWIMQIPWLAIGPCTMIVCAISVFGYHVLNLNSTHLLFPIATGLFLVWTGLALIAPVMWNSRWRASCESLAVLKTNRALPYTLILSIAIALCAAGVGFVGGLVGFAAAATWGGTSLFGDM
ncbi:MAG: hypothetical protein H6815_10095 [Phycisphaeraceae bacterium]|nr:hypothetical protein [Phycisphaerales bacterium]MCB9860789.1 hypothetical protein [Phycisphaeraceae bacterium]